MNKEEIIKRLKVLIKIANNVKAKEFEISLTDIVSSIEQLSDKPQISDEDFEELLKTLTLFCKTTWLGEVFDDDIKKENIKLYLEKYLKPQPSRTQGDKIRAMSNEELIIILSNTFTKCPYCMYRGKPCKMGNMCNQGILEFLNSEVKND